jgi:hypothetical protein
VLSVLLADGMGGFAAPLQTLLGAAGGVGVLWVGDWTGDGKQDLVLYFSATRSARVYVGDGAGGFIQGPMIPGTGDSPFAVADLDGDGKQDVILASGGQVLLYTNNGADSFRISSLGAYPSDVRRLVIADFNSDKRMDLVVATIINGGYVLLGTSGGLGPPIGLRSNVMYPYYYNETWWVLTGDFNGDQHLDLYLGGPRSTLYWGNGRGGFDSQTGLSLNPGIGEPGLALDMNHDRKLDLVTFESGAGTVWMNGAL